jgi:beta-phosphoglucomutase-like phosphatase (HAD superfamily)
VFDLDGTLLDTEALRDEAMLRALAHILKNLLYSDFARTGFRARVRPAQLMAVLGVDVTRIRTRRRARTACAQDRVKVVATITTFDYW